jgi:hypothetical protein
VLAQVLPARICLFNEYNLFLASPGFDLLFAIYGDMNVVKTFKIHKPFAPVGPGEALDFTGFVLHDAEEEIAGHTGIEGSGSAGDDVNPILVREAIFHGEDGSRERLASVWAV